MARAAARETGQTGGWHCAQQERYRAVHCPQLSSTAQRSDFLSTGYTQGQLRCVMSTILRGPLAAPAALVKPSRQQYAAAAFKPARQGAAAEGPHAGHARLCAAADHRPHLPHCRLPLRLNRHICKSGADPNPGEPQPAVPEAPAGTAVATAATLPHGAQQECVMQMAGREWSIHYTMPQAWSPPCCLAFNFCVLLYAPSPRSCARSLTPAFKS